MADPPASAIRPHRRRKTVERAGRHSSLDRRPERQERKRTVPAMINKSSIAKKQEAISGVLIRVSPLDWTDHPEMVVTRGLALFFARDPFHKGGAFPPPMREYL
jgi:hypothetical protein